MLESWSPTLFSLAGGLFVVFAAFWAAFAFTDLSSEIVQNAVGPAGWTAAFVGLLGLYPALADQNPRIASAGAVFAVFGLVGGTFATGGNLLLLIGVLSELPAWLAPLQLPLLIGIVFGFLTVGLASLRTSVMPRRVGVLLLIPAAVFVVNIVRVGTLGSTTPIWAPFVLGSGQALALLGIGYSLRAVAFPADSAASSVDSTVG
ncbi:hypothetical protein [Halobaculum halobium]|uniref:Uncharacterized protein n=1 Tax=Halobaculum halobium TaxID=3032281 RepID=A0ABD5T5Q3_9EURY|nr:hypothetical protein [Halobaculum sp. SYNS20]